MNSALRPFVLRCPNCLAGVESGTSKCRYCGAPMVWEPRESLSRDDFWMHAATLASSSDNDADQDKSVAESSLGPALVKYKSTTVFQIHAQVLFRPTHVWVHPAIASSFHIKSVRVGADEVLSLVATSSSIPAIRFMQGRGFPIDSETVTPGVIINVIVENVTLKDEDFIGIVRGRVLPRSESVATSPLSNHVGRHILLRYR